LTTAVPTSTTTGTTKTLTTPTPSFVPYIGLDFVPDNTYSFNGISYNGLTARGFSFTAGPDLTTANNKITSMRLSLKLASCPSGTEFSFRIPFGFLSDSFRIDLRDQSSGKPGTTVHAYDTITYACPTGTFVAALDASHLVNISSYTLSNSGLYSLSIYNSKYNGNSDNSLTLSRTSVIQSPTYNFGYSNANFSTSAAFYSGAYLWSIGAFL